MDRNRRQQILDIIMAEIDLNTKKYNSNFNKKGNVKYLDANDRLLIIFGEINNLIWDTEIYTLPFNDVNLIKVTEKYGETHRIEAIKGTKIEMDKLEDNQSVCWGDGKNYHFRLTTL